MSCDQLTVSRNVVVNSLDIRSLFYFRKRLPSGERCHVCLAIRSELECERRKASTGRSSCLVGCVADWRWPVSSCVRTRAPGAISKPSPPRLETHTLTPTCFPDSSSDESPYELPPHGLGSLYSFSRGAALNKARASAIKPIRVLLDYKNREHSYTKFTLRSYTCTRLIISS